ncbi:MAG: hypothetical protein COB83_03795 [Gammaproteobacteria bacterium]|nr:MAG: hypothetical protein COB83_03795 [Gammaproteobacteria bacterium]
MSTASGGEWRVNVIKPTINTQIWNVDINVISDPSNFGNSSVTILNSVREAVEVEQGFSEILVMMSKSIDVYFDSIPNYQTIGAVCTDTASYTLCGFLSTYLRGLPESAILYNNNIITFYWRKIFGFKVIRYIIHYPDGSAIIYQSEVGGSLSPAIAFTPVSKSIINSDGSVNDTGFYSEVPSGGIVYSIPSLSGGGTTCDTYMWVTRVNGEITKITFSCI